MGRAGRRIIGASHGGDRRGGGRGGGGKGGRGGSSRDLPARARGGASSSSGATAAELQQRLDALRSTLAAEGGPSDEACEAEGVELEAEAEDAPTDRLSKSQRMAQAADPTVAGDGLQWRFSWLGFPGDSDDDKIISESFTRNGGIVAFSRLRGLDSHWSIPDSLEVASEFDHVTVFWNKGLVEHMEELHDHLEIIPRPYPLSCIRFCGRVFKATFFANCALASGLNEVTFVVLAVTHMDWTDRQADFGELEWFDAPVEETVDKFLTDCARWNPRIVMGDVGFLAEGFHVRLENIMLQHACWCCKGPSPPELTHPDVLAPDESGSGPRAADAPTSILLETPHGVITSGIWLIGRHMRLRGPGAAGHEHECCSGPYLDLVQPRVTTLQLTRLPEGCVGVPTLHIGRSARSSARPEQRPPAVHRAGAYTEEMCPAQKRIRPAR